ncbi:tyrosine-type recombinase/integrase [Qipengyuania gaetbuli]|uniref:tyrosine-type recombinase/integrase n=1 Tax=Qipengyuania gaetbuli TaxID=266952 RepID=UPI001C98EC40|nr:tyrosine-type recombinase/integrase [Qipengyuania gaetbuli]MBY6014689.1 tyrosine-type recombinase/integrase [Qipengyuania gaetbuli]
MQDLTASAPYWAGDALFADVVSEELNFVYSRIAPRPTASVEERAGQMLASAIFHGALLCRAFWKNWLEAATTSVWLDQDLAWVDIAPTDPSNSGPDSQTRRWFADPITRLLLAHWHKDGLRLQHYDPDQCLRAYFGPSEFAWGERLLRYSSQHWRLRIPPVLVAHALDFHRAVPPETEDWQRVLGFGREVKSKDDDKNQIGKSKYEKSSGADDGEPVPTDLPPQTKESSYDPELREVFRILKASPQRKPPKRVTAEKISSILQTTPPGSPWLAVRKWCASALVNQRGRHSPGLEPATVKNYLGCLVADVFCANDRPETWSETELHERYEQSLEAIDFGTRRTKVHNAISSFHKYLQSENADLEDLPEELNRFRGEDRSAVNLLSPDEFAVSLKKCDSREHRLIMMLSFRAGLRLTETLGLMIGDFHFYGDGQCNLVVAKNAIRRLKTPESRRILPLDLLLDREEFAELRTWIDYRRALAAPTRAKGMLFGPIDGEKPLQAQPVEEQLGKLLHQVTGTALTVHHLRHSFASYLLTTLLLPNDNRGVRVPAQLTNVISYSRRKLLADRLLGSQKLGQHAVHAVSEAMGHILSSTTLRSYSHLLDLSLCQYVSQPSVEATLPDQEVRLLTGQNKPRAASFEPGKLAESTTYLRPSYPTDPLVTAPGTFQVSHVRGRHASRIERPLRASKLRLKRVKAWAGKPVTLAPQDPDWRDIALGVSKRHRQLSNETWRASAKALKELRDKAGNSRHAIGLNILDSPKWLKLVDKHWRPRLSLTKEQRRALFYAVEKWDYTRCGVRFTSRPMAVVWRELLLKLGFDASQIRISLTGRFEHRASKALHQQLATSIDLPGTSARRGRRGSILIRFYDESTHSRHLKDAGHFIILILAIREGYGLPAVEK